MRSLARLKCIVPAAVFWLMLVARLPARTIVLTDEDCRRVAAIAAEAPRLSWAAGEYSAGSFQTRYVDIAPNRSFLICYPLDRIPKGQRITNAEWEIPVMLTSASEQRLYVRRIVGDWGAGVCHTYRSTRPQKIPWSVPGALGSSLDRALKSSGVMHANGPGHCTLNVTEDLQLWYTGAVANQGWILNGEDAGALVRLHAPLSAGRGQWKLRITYEPE